jgi:hypothetical protein
MRTMATVQRTFFFGLAALSTLVATGAMVVILHVGVAHESLGPLHPEIDQPAVIMHIPPLNGPTSGKEASR